MPNKPPLVVICDSLFFENLISYLRSAVGVCVSRGRREKSDLSPLLFFRFSSDWSWFLFPYLNEFFPAFPFHQRAERAAIVRQSEKQERDFRLFFRNK